MEDVQQAIVVGPAPTGTGDGGVIKQQLVATPEGQPNQQTAYIPIALALVARTGSIFFFTMSGQLGAGAVGVIAQQSWKNALLISASAAAVGLVTSLATVFANLERKYPIVSQLT
jgi:hypothetical protein